jgi:hypothetical protein
LCTSSAQENFRLARFYRRSPAFIGGQYGVFAFALGREKKHMNADNPEVLRSGGSSGVAGISTFMSRTQLGQRDPGLPIPMEPASLEAAVERRMEI